jgi:hypothetical protein
MENTRMHFAVMCDKSAAILKIWSRLSVAGRSRNWGCHPTHRPHFVLKPALGPQRSDVWGVGKRVRVSSAVAGVGRVVVMIASLEALPVRTGWNGNRSDPEGRRSLSSSAEAFGVVDAGGQRAGLVLAGVARRCLAWWVVVLLQCCFPSWDTNETAAQLPEAGAGTGAPSDAPAANWSQLDGQPAMFQG